ncbi:MAG: hypothetical protein LBD64_02555 [Odoribacteraceae bacterium]|jgi:hypothetical protein|nr:hypothetical protein [Odoribacteraceae bacterium]
MATTKKVAAHYILLPGCPLLKNGIVTWTTGEKPRVEVNVHPGKELQGVEFHAGMIVAERVREQIRDWQPGDSLVKRVEHLYAAGEESTRALAIIQGADWKRLAWTGRTIITKIT